MAHVTAGATADPLSAQYGVLEDPFGHKWSVATHARDMSPREMQEGMAKMGG